MTTSHVHPMPVVTCPNCGQAYIGSTLAAIGLSGSHTHASVTHMANAPLAPEVVKTFAKDDDPELNEWRKTHIG